MKVTLIAIAVIVAVSLLLMPAFVRAPQPVQQQLPGVDPALPH